MTNYIKLSLLALSLLLIANSPLSAQDQKFSVVFNVSNFHINKANSGGTAINYDGSTSLLLNGRYFTSGNWAIRLGVGLDNLKYTVADSITTNYDARRKDLKGVLGVEKHFKVAMLDFYPGLFVPITVVGEDVIGQNFNSLYDDIKNGDIRAGLGFVAGANIRLLKLLLVGVEFDATFDDFQAGFRDGVNQLSFAPISEVNFNTTFTIGVTF